ncbi:hypothetical protein [Paenibacillus sp. MBLB4367]|uniref:hypothetical protein n=1 Tax=Paenibacillus sp. MBLB4367 TaxID=3384767 RepID=UPI0039082863
MIPSVVTFKNKAIQVYRVDHKANLEMLVNKLKEMEYDFVFRKKLKRILSVDLVRDVAIFKYNDGTKLYLELSQGEAGKNAVREEGISKKSFQ